MNKIVQRKASRLSFGTRENPKRAFSYIVDVAPILAHAPWNPKARNRVFNVGADQPYTVSELAHRVAEAMEAGPNVVHLPSRKEVDLAFSEHSACREVFGLVPQTPLTKGLSNMAGWVKKAGTRESKLFDAKETRRAMPPSWLLENSSRNF